MGWIAINKKGEILREEEHGRPVQAGEEGSLLCIAQEDFGHKVCIDLINGIIFFDYETLSIQNMTVEISNPRLITVVCDESNIVGEILQREETEPDSEGNIYYTFLPLLWRPIWFTRYTNGIPTKAIGLQTTLPKEYGGRNIKKVVYFFETGVIGVD